MCDVHDVNYFGAACELDHPELQCSCHLRLKMRSDAEIYAALEVAGSISEVEAKQPAAKKWLSDQLARGLLLARKEDRDARSATEPGGALEQAVHQQIMTKQLPALLKPIGFVDWSRVETLDFDTYYSITTLPDGRIVSGSGGDTVKIFKERTDGSGGWDCTATLTGHSDIVWSVAALSETRIVSSSEDETVKVWTERAGVWDCTATLAVHGSPNVAALSETRIVSGGEDKTVKVWTARPDGSDDWDCTATLTGHSSSVRSVAALSENRIVSSDDQTVKVWTARPDGSPVWDCTATLTEHTSRHARCVAALSENRFISGGSYGLGVWTARPDGSDDWDCTATLTWPTHVRYVAALSENRFISGSDEWGLYVYTARLDGSDDWDWPAHLTGHSDYVTSVAALSDGRFVSCSLDEVKIWG